MNLKTSSKRYHYDTKQGVRNAKAETMTRLFTFEEESDRNRVAAEIGEMPSPKGSTWSSYIKHRLRVMENGIDTYTTRNYARLHLDKHIEWHRAIDKLAGSLVNHKPAIIFIGAGGNSPNSPISIRKHVRCPGTRKLIEAFEKRSNCIVLMVDEFNTSQHCAKCFNKFDRRTKAFRFKQCSNCQPNHILQLPTRIITNVSKRILQMRRTIIKEWQQMRNMGNQIAAVLTQSSTRRLVSKKQSFLKTWLPNANVNGDGRATAESEITVWHRDICAAKLILYRGN